MGCFGFSSSSVSDSSKKSLPKTKLSNPQPNRKPLPIIPNKGAKKQLFYKIPAPPLQQDTSPSSSCYSFDRNTLMNALSKRSNSTQQFRLSGFQNSGGTKSDEVSEAQPPPRPPCCNKSSELNDLKFPRSNSADSARAATSNRGKKPVTKTGPMTLKLKQPLQNPKPRDAKVANAASPASSNKSVSPQSSPASGKPLSQPQNAPELALFEANAKRIAELRTFTYLDLKIATRNFSIDQQIGLGGFGAVYRGYIKPSAPSAESRTELSNGQQLQQVVAIKKLDAKSLQGHKEWMMEVSFLGLFDHPNLVKLVGYCAEGDKRLLVYEYMNNTSLDRFLFGTFRAPLDWYTRLKIALGTARGLAYLHEEVQPQVIYRDFKTSNILLDSIFNPKLSDFGLAREGPKGEETHVSTEVRGTAGYASPEYIITGHLTPKNDVWGFGVVILELLTGRPCLDKSRPMSEHNLVNFCRPYLNEPRKFQKIADPRFQGSFPPRGLQKLAELARWCLVSDPHSRPTMSEIVQVLSFLVSFKEPNAPGGGDWGEEHVIKRLQKRDEKVEEFPKETPSKFLKFFYRLI